MASRSGGQLQADRILIARLNGTALRMAHTKASTEEGVASLLEITDRTDLLGQAAGGFLLDVRNNDPLRSFSPAALRYLVAAGADKEHAETAAAVAAERAVQIPTAMLPRTDH